MNCSVQFSHSVMSNSLQPLGLQYASPSCQSTTFGVYPNSCPLNQWCHPTISFSVIPISSHLQSFPESGSIQISQLFASGGQSIGVSASGSVLPMNISGLIFFKDGLVGPSCSPRTLKWLLQHHSSKASILQRSALFIVQLAPREV